VHDLPRARLLLVDTEDDVRAPIEDEVLAGRGLLKAGDVPEAAREMRRDRAHRSDDVGPQRGQRGRDERGCGNGGEKRAHDEPAVP
jgi:hypothetical protein